VVLIAAAEIAQEGAQLAVAEIAVLPAPAARIRLKVVARALVPAVSIFVSTPVPRVKRSVGIVSTRHAESVRHED
jgi:hypothetical protein